MLQQKIKVFVVFALFSLSFFVSSTAILAASQSTSNSNTASTETTVTAENLGVSDPKLLPTSRFYVIKDIFRGVQRLLTFDPIKRVELESNIADEKIMEAKKIAEASPGNQSALDHALENYRASQENLKKRLSALEETLHNPAQDNFIEKLVDHAVKHEQLFIELEQKIGNNMAAKQSLKLTKDTLENSVVEAAKKDGKEKFSKRLETAT